MVRFRLDLYWFKEGSWLWDKEVLDFWVTKERGPASLGGLGAHSLSR